MSPVADVAVCGFGGMIRAWCPQSGEQIAEFDVGSAATTLHSHRPECRQ